MTLSTVRVAAVQATPVILDGDATIAKAVRLIGEAAEQGARLVVLPETFVSVYPSNRWAAAAARFGGFDALWERMWASSVDVPGPLVDRLVDACRRHDVTCAIGVNERESARHALQHAAAPRPGRADLPPPQADADDAGAAVPRDRRGRRPDGRPTRRSAASAG